MDKNFLYFNYMSKEDKYFMKINESTKSRKFVVDARDSEWKSIVDNNNVWKFYMPYNINMQEQGWKIHISTTLENAQHTLDVVSEILIKNKIPFKHIVDEKMLHTLNSKNGNRVSSGKFITIYPNDDIFIKVLEDLYQELKSFEKGPYILSDKSWKNSNIYYRYGGFKTMYSKEGLLSIKDDKGNLVPDKRTPYYYVPPFVTEPPELLLGEKNLKTESNNTSSNLSKYEFKTPFKFTNSGGIYLAERKSDGQKVVVKEARYKSGLDGNNRDAIQRMNTEYKYLTILKDVKGVVNIVDYFKVWENEFIVEEFAEGLSLTHWIAHHYPFHLGQDMKNYIQKLRTIFDNLIKTVSEMHSYGVGMGDIQPSNIIVNDNLDIKLIDFEAANDAMFEDEASMFTIGFANSLNKNNKERDWYGVKKVLRYSILPIGPVETIYQSITSYHNEWIISNFGQEVYDYISEIEKTCDAHLSKTKAAISCDTNKPELNKLNLINREGINKLRESIISNCDLSRNSLIQGDIRQYESPGGEVNLLTGGYGAVLALSRTGELDSKVKKWINDNLKYYDYKSIPSGLLTGKAGIASVLYEIGLKEESLNLIKKINLDYSTDDISLRSGLSGIGLVYANLYKETKEDIYLDKCKDIFENIKSFINQKKSLRVEDWASVPIGLIDGWSGVSIFTTIMYEITGDEDYYNLSVELISRDIQNSQEDEDLNILQTKDSKNRLLPYLSGGSIGIGVAIWFINKMGKDIIFNKELKQIINTNKIRCTFSAGLLDGAGSFLIIPALMDENYRNTRDEVIRIAIERLNLYMINQEDKFLCPGNFSYKLSSDLYSGSSGILIGIKCIMEKNPLYWLPLRNF